MGHSIGSLSGPRAFRIALEGGSGLMGYNAESERVPWISGLLGRMGSFRLIKSLSNSQDPF